MKLRVHDNSGETYDFKGEDLDFIDSGNLRIYSDDKLIATFAEGQWKLVERVEEATTPTVPYIPIPTPTPCPGYPPYHPYPWNPNGPLWYSTNTNDITVTAGGADEETKSDSLS